uniref:Uncharacterized protein n=1 Tax=Eutreptiella gymnastica TaxID=73025 RepID=A0A7S1JEE6_9EUGL|mmetsp:Transcript_87968/g.152996  ORF Transcript_87968/g.152996 Transcript_87968/m.152996 type:complete len:108 (+) Transcript_87968:64-387(+)
MPYHVPCALFQKCGVPCGVPLVPYIGVMMTFTSLSVTSGSPRILCEYICVIIPFEVGSEWYVWSEPLEDWESPTHQYPADGSESFTFVHATLGTWLTTHFCQNLGQF